MKNKILLPAIVCVLLLNSGSWLLYADVYAWYKFDTPVSIYPIIMTIVGLFGFAYYLVKILGKDSHSDYHNEIRTDVCDSCGEVFHYTGAYKNICNRCYSKL
jgi:hypothetical protein